MLKHALVLSLVLATAALTGCETSIRVPSADLALSDVAVLNAASGEFVDGQTVLVDGGRIVALGESERVEVPEGARVIRGDGRFLIPGLWDMHVHAWGPSPFTEIFLQHGITTIREMGTGTDPQFGGTEGVWTWRDDVRQGRLPGPRIFAAGFILNGGEQEQQGAQFFKATPTPEDARRWVDSLGSAEADFIKIYSALTPESFEAIAEAASERGLGLAGHVPALVGTRDAASGGLQSLEHLYDVLVATSSDEEQLRSEIRAEVIASEIPTAAAQVAERARIDRLIATHDPEKALALFDLFERTGTWLSPTLVVSGDPRCPEVPLEVPDSASLADLGFIQAFVRLPDLSEEELGRSCRRFARLSELTGEIDRAGLPILTGSDAPNPGVRPGLGFHDELFLLVEAGLSPERVLRAATHDAARFMGAADSLGTVEVGKLADLVLLEADPLDDIRNTRRIAAVIANGRVVHEGPGCCSDAFAAEPDVGGSEAAFAASPAPELEGRWIIDLRPTPDAEPYLQEFVVSSATDGTLEGTFYGSQITDGRVNDDWGAIRFAFVTSDGSSSYHTAGVLREGRLEGTTHALGRGFLSYWTGERAQAGDPD